MPLRRVARCALARHHRWLQRTTYGRVGQRSELRIPAQNKNPPAQLSQPPRTGGIQRTNGGASYQGASREMSAHAGNRLVQVREANLAHIKRLRQAVPTLIAVLINEALTGRLQRGRP